MIKGTVAIDQNRCKGCGLCVTFCPQNVLALEEELLNAKSFHPAHLISEDCTGCGVCALVCPDVCFTVYREAAHPKGKGLRLDAIPVRQRDPLPQEG